VSRSDIQEALLRLDELTRRLRRECPWDREQDERTIVPHTLEEAYELADAANRRDDGKLLDELGDVLFQVHFLALLLEERGAGDLAAVAENTRRKLIRRHPHIFPPDSAETDAALKVAADAVETSGEVLANWDKIKQGEEGRERGIFAEVPENLPSPLYARKVQRRAASSGFDFPGVEGPLQSVRDELDELIEVAEADGEHARDARFHELGDVLFAAVNVARKLQVDPEIALRAASDRFRGRVEGAAELASGAGRSWEDLDTDEQLGFYLRARMNEPEPGDRDA
jgi:XTP/dITP diphosphohydrolase/tetrapyrrole methylase family protein/MazG family protein/ATP diphosphatase